MNNSANEIDDYIDRQSENARGILYDLRRTIKNAVPEAEELLSYNIPAFTYHGRLVWYAAFKNHYSIFFRRNVLQKFTDELKSFELSESGSAIKVQFDKPLPSVLLDKILKAGVKANLESEKLKPHRKKKTIS